MRFEIGAPVTVERRHDTLVWERVHLPGRIDEATDPCPLTWRSLCGLDGWLYAYDGMIRTTTTQFCTVCVGHTNLQASADFRAGRKPPRRLVDELLAEVDRALGIAA